jgi:hypothetical protein
MTKAEELINKHLDRLNANNIIGKDGNIYKGFLNAINEAINYNRCCEELKDKKKLNYEEWKFSKGLRYMFDFTYKNAKGKLFESEDLVKMYEAYKSL